MHAYNCATVKDKHGKIVNILLLGHASFSFSQCANLFAEKEGKKSIRGIYFAVK